jgi:hypothetical protein
LKPEWWGSPLVQEKYQGEIACGKRRRQCGGGGGGCDGVIKKPRRFENIKTF